LPKVAYIVQWERAICGEKRRGSGWGIEKGDKYRGMAE
jgi:hypothetical protein